MASSLSTTRTATVRPLQPSFSAPLMFFGGLLFGYGMVLSNGCGSRALVLLGRGNLRSFVVVVVLAVFAQMTLKGLIAPARIAMVAASQTTVKANSIPALLATAGLTEMTAHMLAGWAISSALMIFAFVHPAFRRSPGQIAAGLVVGVLVAAGWVATGYLGADDFNPTPVTSLTFIAPIADALQYVMLSTGSTLNFGIVTVFGVFAGSLVTALVTGRFHLEGYQSPRHMLRSAGGSRADGRRRRDGVWVFGRAGADGFFDAGVGVAGRGRWNYARHRRRSARRAPRPSAGRRPNSASFVKIRTSDVSVRCTGHLSAIPSAACADRCRARLRS